MVAEEGRIRVQRVGDQAHLTAGGQLDPEAAVILAITHIAGQHFPGLIVQRLDSPAADGGAIRVLQVPLQRAKPGRVARPERVQPQQIIRREMPHSRPVVDVAALVAHRGGTVAGVREREAMSQLVFGQILHELARVQRARADVQDRPGGIGDRGSIGLPR